MSTTLLQLFLLLIVFVMGVLVTIAVQHAYAHYHPQPHEAEKPHPATAPGGHLPAAVKERLVQQSQANFQAVLDKSAADLEHDLERTSNELNKVLQKIGTEVVGNEMERYRLQLDQIRKEAATAISGAQDEISKHQADLKAKLEEEQATVRAKLSEEITAEKQRLVQEIVAEKQQLLQQIDTKLADAMASFLLESLGHNVDLGAQTAYLTALLEEHKADFKREVSNEA
jgi:F0F1-type ATP synthase membrane subunit b/b'